VQDHQTVKQGALLFTIDPAPFQIAVAGAEAQLALSRQQVAGSTDQVAVASAEVLQRQSQLTDIQKNTQRILILSNKGLMPKASADDAKERLQVAQAALAAAKSRLQQVQQELGQVGESNAQIQAAAAKLAQAQLNLAHTRITAPADGILVNFTLRPGSMVTVQTPLFALIENHHWWVDANFKETALKRIRVGQLATIHLDIYPDHVFHGVVQGISAGSGAAFSILPPENATGNWVKVTQRFPVRVDITDPNPKYPLRVGASSTVTIDTH
jgi:membrane fusion protein (multidrug efflux system)